MNTGPALPGWYGKLPALGDFASRRLAPDFIEFWDGWLADGMQALREQGEQKAAGWLDAYLVSPTWRFVLTPGCLPGSLGERAWAGVLMPSVDRVGRYYPFTLLHPLAQLPLSLHGLQALWQELGRLDDVAADALQDDWSAERLEAELAELAVSGLKLRDGPVAPVVAELALVAGELRVLPSGLDGAGQMAGEALQLWGPQVGGRSYWLAGAAANSQNWRVCKGLPRSAAALLGG